MKIEELNLPQFELTGALQKDDCIESYKTGETINNFLGEDILTA